MNKLFDDSDNEEEINLKTNNEYAKSYADWREKEEVHKLEAKYGDEAKYGEDADEDEESDEDIEVSDMFEKDFLKTLSLIKKKDPRIYDKQFKCFENVPEQAESPVKVQKKAEKEKPLLIRDYQRKIILEKGGILSDDEDELSNKRTQRPQSPSNVEEEKLIKESFAKVLNEDEEADGNNEGTIAGLFQRRQKTEEEMDAEEKSYREWITGQIEHLGDTKEEKELETLKEFWSDPKLNEREVFLRDYILKQRYLERNDSEYIPTYDEVVHDSEDDLEEDENTVKEQLTFEHKYNFRFEEPDQEFLKRYPRTMENSMRRKETKRAQKRAEVKNRKAEEKQRKMEEIGRLKAFKLKEIQEKIAKLKVITGNENLAFHDEDIEGEFDPAQHDKRMKALFNEEFDSQQETEKPVFPDIDDELELEDWDNYETADVGTKQGSCWQDDQTELHCEDENFNMDADYDPNKPKTSLLDEITQTLGKKRRNRKQKSKLAQILATEKPKFDPFTADQTYSQYLEEYYKLDCEDVIGDLPCRFKYREVVPNSYGLSIEEILEADDKELNQWMPLKKIQKLRPHHKEKGDVTTYKIRAQNLDLKKRLLPSLFKEPEKKADDPKMENSEENDDTKQATKKKKKKNKKPEENGNIQLNDNTAEQNNENPQTDEVAAKETIESDSTSVKKKKKKQKDMVSKGQSNIDQDNIVKTEKDSTCTEADSEVPRLSRKERSKRKLQETLNTTEGSKNKKSKTSKWAASNAKPFKKGGANSNQKHSNDTNKISDERLKAYGLNPKKYKTFLEHKKF